jgi:hypothetical protein
MSMPERIERHVGLVRRMAAATGADVDGAMARGTLGLEEWSEAVRRCTGCARPGACGAWLDAHPVAPETPDYCRNGDFLDRLRP